MNEVLFTTLTRSELIELIKVSLREELNVKKEKEFLNAKEVCELLGISLSCLNNYKASGKIPFQKINKRVVFNRQDVLSALRDESHFLKLKLLEG